MFFDAIQLVPVHRNGSSTVCHSLENTFISFSISGTGFTVICSIILSFNFGSKKTVEEITLFNLLINHTSQFNQLFTNVQSFGFCDSTKGSNNGRNCGVFLHHSFFIIFCFSTEDIFILLTK